MPKSTFFNLSDEKKKRIIDSAVTEFAKDHYRKVTIDSIVQGAGIPKGSFYQYFKNKDDLYKYIFAHIGDRKKLYLDQIDLNKHQLSFKECVIQIFDQAQTFESLDIKLVALKERFVNECSQELRREILKNEIPKSIDLLEDVIKSYVAKGELKANLNTKHAAYIVTLSIVSLEHYQPYRKQSIRDFIADILEIIISGMR